MNILPGDQTCFFKFKEAQSSSRMWPCKVLGAVSFYQRQWKLQVLGASRNWTHVTPQWAARSACNSVPAASDRLCWSLQCKMGDKSELHCAVLTCVIPPPIPTQKFIASYLQTRGSWGSASGVASHQVILYFWLAKLTGGRFLRSLMRESSCNLFVHVDIAWS